MSKIENSTNRQYKCPNCEASISFHAKSQKMSCEYCDSELDLTALEELNAIHEETQKEIEWVSYEEGNGSKSWEEEEKKGVKKYACQSCAASILTDDVTVATKCPYCENPVILPSEMEEEYRPDLVIPFQVSKEDAIKAFGNYLNNKKLLPNLFKDYNHLQDITGVYVPFWLFDSKTIGNLTYKGTKTKMWTSGEYRYTRHDHYLVKRSGRANFVKVPADGSSKMDDTMMEAIEPFDFTKGVDFNTAYLSGYLAQNYDVDSKELTPRVKERMEQSLTRLCEKTVLGYQTKILSHKHIFNKEGEINYALLPVWILNTKYKDTIYTFAMNGQTGKFVGELPIDKAKAFTYFVKTFTISGLGCGLIYGLMQLFM